MEYKQSSNLILQTQLFLDDHNFKEENNNAQTVVASIGLVHIDALLQEISDSYRENGSIGIINSLSKLLVCARNAINYHIKFKELSINQWIVDMLGTNHSIENQNIAIDLITNLANQPEDFFLTDLIECNVISALIDLYYKRCDDNIIIVQALSFIISKNVNYRNQVLENIELNQFFSPLLSNSTGESNHLTIYLNFLWNVLIWEDLPNDAVQLYFAFAKRILPQWINKSTIISDLFNIIREKISDHPNFQTFVREIDLISRVFETLETVLAFLDYTKPKTKYHINEEHNPNKFNDLIKSLVCFLGVTFEQPIETEINFVLLRKLVEHPKKDIKIVTIFAIGNLFESMPETIAIFNESNLFQTLYYYIENEDAETKIESVICCSTAICFSTNEMRQKFIENNFLPILCDTLAVKEIGLRYLVVRAVISIIDTICIGFGNQAALEAMEDADISGIFDYIDELTPDNEFIAALNDLKTKIEEIKSNEES
ncbi:hypothetical protein TRFO_28483 [Tritrichomonas foetus]|uniref:Uncharacterized protein n=1 Tax=Tritrichomonas foetus TaxID=1144522 RepID=A0A1J4K3I6_9EUKA|nr:hypothetical protein TRFO_28483 [Tritrichomonas foetus]|eukprot:OHT04053.1 hypothetical protein TRFO_28483 [Tritrichomonas foetus]